MKWAGVNLSLGPHQAIRHPALRRLWWQLADGREEMLWDELWTLLAEAARVRSGVEAAGGAHADAQETKPDDVFGIPEELAALAGDSAARTAVQSAVGARWIPALGSSEAAGFVTPPMLDAAMPPGASLLEVLRNLRLQGLKKEGPDGESRGWGWSCC